MKKIFSIINAILAMVLFATPTFLHPVCSALMQNGRPMSCHYTHIMIMIISGIILLLAIIAIAINKSWLYVTSYISTGILALLCYLAPERIIKIGNMKINGWAVGLCGSPEHSCSQTMSSIIVLVIIICVVNVLFSLYSMIARRK